VGEASNYLLEEQMVTVAFNDGTPLYVDLPPRSSSPSARPTQASRATARPAHQAGHARDRRHHPGAAVHLDGGEDQGRHEDGQYSPGLMGIAFPLARHVRA